MKKLTFKLIILLALLLAGCQSTRVTIAPVEYNFELERLNPPKLPPLDSLKNGNFNYH